MTKYLISILISTFCLSAMGGESLCGKTAGFSYNHDTIKRPYQLSGFWLKQNTQDIRITYGNSPELVTFVEGLEGNIFLCLDEYKLVKKTYSGKNRTYAQVEQFRAWVNGKLVSNKPVDYDNTKITCDIIDHPVYSKTVVHGDSEIHFIKKDGTSASVHHDGYLFENTKKGLSAIYHDGDDLLFYLNHAKDKKSAVQGFVEVPGDGDHDIKNCTLSAFKGW